MGNMHNVIVTGATGFVGRRLIDELDNRFGDTCHSIALGSQDVDLTDQRATFDWFADKAKSFECDHIIHLAALYKPGDWSVKNPATQFFVNMAVNINVMEAWRRYYPKAKLTSTISSSVYPDHDNAHPETDAFGVEPEDGIFAYAFTKKAQLQGQRAYGIEEGLSSTSAVLPTVYGPGNSFAEDGPVVNALIGRFSRAVTDGKDAVEIWGSGRQQREFLYVDDAVDGILAAALGAKSPLLNLGSGKPDTILELAYMIAEEVDFKGEITTNSQKFEGAIIRAMDVSLIRSELGWTASTSTREGIRKTVDWYNKNEA